MHLASILQLKPKNDSLERLRTGVVLAREAVKAVSITAMEAIREGATFVGILSEEDELIDPFAQLDGPIWSENLLKNFSPLLTDTARN